METPGIARRYFWEGYRTSIPLMLGVAPFGLVFGALAVSVGMSTIEALAMSILVLAGSSQFIGAQLIGDGAPIWVIVLTTFVVNLRHFLYSASLADYFRPLSRGWKALIAYLMVDEVYAVFIIRRGSENLSPFEMRWYFVGVAFDLVSVWWGTTVIGALLSNSEILPEKVQNILGFTLPLVFTTIVVPSLVKKPFLAAAASGAVTGILLAPLPHKLGLFVAAAVGIMAGVWVETRENRQKKGIA